MPDDARRLRARLLHHLPAAQDRDQAARQVHHVAAARSMLAHRAPRQPQHRHLSQSALPLLVRQQFRLQPLLQRPSQLSGALGQQSPQTRRSIQQQQQQQQQQSWRAGRGSSRATSGEVHGERGGGGGGDGEQLVRARLLRRAQREQQEDRSAARALVERRRRRIDAPHVHDHHCRGHVHRQLRESRTRPAIATSKTKQSTAQIASLFRSKLRRLRRLLRQRQWQQQRKRKRKRLHGRRRGL